jgi:hypothetical protein
MISRLDMCAITRPGAPPLAMDAALRAWYPAWYPAKSKGDGFSSKLP